MSAETTLWKDAVITAIRRHTARHGIFTRQEFLEAELLTIIEETGTVGKTPGQTVSRELQELRDIGLVEFVVPGVYRLC
jgi:putative restriction endonuclease